MGVSDEEIIGIIQITSFPPFVKANITNYFTSLIKNNISFDFESPLIETQTGKPLYLHCRGISNQNPEGKIVSFDILIGDITKLKRAEYALKQNEKKYREMNEFLPSPCLKQIYMAI